MVSATATVVACSSGAADDSDAAVREPNELLVWVTRIAVGGVGAAIAAWLAAIMDDPPITIGASSANLAWW